MVQSDTSARCDLNLSEPRAPREPVERLGTQEGRAAQNSCCSLSPRSGAPEGRRSGSQLGADKEAAAGAGLARAQQPQPVNFHWGSSELMSSVRDTGQSRSCQWLRGIPQESWEGKGPFLRERPHARPRGQDPAFHQTNSPGQG